MDSKGSPRQAITPQLSKRRLAGIGMLLLVASVVFLWFWQPWYVPSSGEQLTKDSQAPQSFHPDPRLSYSTPYKNIHPDVKYVGDEACARCHSRLTESYHKHPMGRSIASVVTAEGVERFDAASRNPFTVGNLTYRIDRHSDGVRHVEVATDRVGKSLTEAFAEIDRVVGSGRNGRAYLLNRDGYLFQSPITWYPQKKSWDLSPGYEKQNPHFGRPITPDCLFCHANEAVNISGTSNRYSEKTLHSGPIGCERCHGPGELHVREREQKLQVVGFDDTIVNPSKLEHSLREAICQQCHLQGHQRVFRKGVGISDFRPGMPLYLFMNDFVAAQSDSEFKFVGAVEQMYASRCFKGSSGDTKMGCVSCHDPHSVPAPEKKAEFYRDRCNICHKDRDCSLPFAARPENNCVTCHMPPTGSTLKHTTVTDHRIIRAADNKSPSPGKAKSLGIDVHPGRVPLVDFHSHLQVGTSPELMRGLGIALVREADILKPAPAARSLLQQALPLLNSAIANDRTDSIAFEARGNVFWDLGRYQEAAADYDIALKLTPDQETTLHLAATLNFQLRNMTLAKYYAERALKVNPWRWEYHLSLANVLAQQSDWTSAAKECHEVLKLHVTEPNARKLLMLCCLRTGQKGDAQRELEKLIDLGYPKPDDLRTWFALQSR